MTSSFQSRLARVQRLAFVAGAVALAAAVAGGVARPKQFFFSYLFGCLFWLGLSLGCFAVTMIHQLTGGRWGRPTRRFWEAGFMILPVMALLFVPVFFGLRQLYPWATPSEVSAEKILQQRHAYQNVPAFIARTIVCFAVWIAMATRLRRWSLAQDATTDAEPTRKARALSAVGVIVFTLLGTVAYVDWIMSLEKEWYSTMFGVIVLIGQILCAYAFGIILLTLFRRQEPLAPVVSRVHYHHLGNLLLTFVLFWTYVSFGQFLIIYSGDLPPELEWYLHRIAGHWKGVIVALAVFHFFVPFFLLLFRTVKLHVKSLAALAALVFAAHVLDVYWLVMPAFHPDDVAVSWLDFATVTGVGGVWLGFFLARLRGAALLPQNDPGMQPALTYGR